MARVNVDTCQMAISTIKLLSRGTCARLQFILYPTLEYGYVCDNNGQRATGPDTCHKRISTEPNLRNGRVRFRIMLVQALATQRGYRSNERFYNISSAKLNRCELNVCTV